MHLRSGWRKLFIMAVVLVVSSSCADDESIGRLTIVNPTPFDLEVMLSDGGRESWLVLGQTPHKSSTVDQMVADMGPTWVFRFRYGGQDVGEVAIDRDELARARWRFEVPSSVAERMRELGFEPQPDK